MSDSTVMRDRPAPPGAVRAGTPERQLEIDWSAAARTPEFKELVRRRRRFIVPATLFYLTWFFGFIVLAGYAPDFMGREFLSDGLTVGYMLALSQFVMTWGLAWLYLRKADRVFDPLAERAARKALKIGAVQRASMARERFPNGAEVSPR
jgi:uncharacterized membrane protein (DUF485 family)